MNQKELLKHIKLGENSDIEFKSAKGGLPKSLWESVSAFANTNGGYIILGVEENNGKFELGSLKNSSTLIKSFWDLHNSSQKLSSPLCKEKDIDVIKIDDNEVVIIHINQAHRTLRPIFINANPYTGTYKRNSDGDYRCTEIEIRQMIRDASDEPQDFGLIEKFSINDIDSETLSGYRNMFRVTNNDHPYNTLDDKEFLIKLGGYKEDRKSNIEGITLAGLLMFGKETSILEAFPHFHLDYQENFSDDPEVRWTHRITSDGRWECNIFNFYMRVYNRLIQDIEVPFSLNREGIRQGETHVHEALREALVNTLVHANHQSTKSITVIKTKDYFSFRNPGRLRISLEQVYQGGISDVRNPYIQRMFQLIGLGEKAGSGFVKILRAWNEQHWMKPQVSEDTFHELTSVKLMYKIDEPSKRPSSDLEKDLINDLEKNLSENQIKIINFMSENNNITQSELSNLIGINEKNIRNNIKKLKDLGLIQRIGSPKNGYWEVKK
ncbi:RNA-binding domain-containing protein [Aliarcobacter butzleri]|uniref:RNA-binding domain-containing protein n=1 Tax=Aliarcobacter butzleri TaxID=28197 RepID=UPI00263DEABA|nr:RNA-binding domain-containing protein [Aliarcobacter butzleri]MDN5081981.1 putative DNA binding domain-containing protein [Aliarcobacter butzleri]MDN5084291.1 putative DNA binding domain-containing protein [Aliarcobacter butzleri]